MNKVYIDKKIMEACNGISYTRPTFFERIKIFFRFMKFKPKKLKEPLLMDLIPKVGSVPRTTTPRPPIEIPFTEGDIEKTMYDKLTKKEKKLYRKSPEFYYRVRGGKW